MNRKYLKYISAFLFFILLLIISFVFFIYLTLFLEVRKICNVSQNEYKSDCVNSLMKVLESSDKSIKEKNDAIWALGQIADKRALPTLKKIYTGNIPEKEPLDKIISQYEIKKAMNWIENGNWTSFMYFKFR